MRDGLFAAVKTVIDEWDPEILLKMGAPSDEYDIESKMIVKQYLAEAYRPDKEEDVDLLRDIIMSVFCKMFSDNYHEQECKIVASKITKLYFGEK